MAGEIHGHVDGLAGFERDIAALPDELDERIKTADAASNALVFGEATKRAQSTGGSYLAVLRLNGLKLSKAQAAASVVLDGAAAPMALGAEKGSTRFHQFNPYRGADGGYALLPALQAKEQAIVDLYGAGVDVELAAAFPD